jgi:hypothetical protein
LTTNGWVTFQDTDAVFNGNVAVGMGLSQVEVWKFKTPGGQYFGVSRRRGKKIAGIAVARKLLGTIYHMMKEEIDYEEFLKRGSNAQ